MKRIYIDVWKIVIIVLKINIQSYEREHLINLKTTIPSHSKTEGKHLHIVRAYLNMFF